MFCQGTVSFIMKGEYNSFAINDIKKLQDLAAHEFRLNRVPISATESFPSYYGYQFRVGLPVFSGYLNNIEPGILFDYSSTGGRLHYKDYSGEAKYDQVIKLYTYGAFAEKGYHLYYDFWAIGGLSLQLIKGSLKSDYILRIEDDEERYSSESSAYAFGFEPDLELRYERYYFYMGFSMGYMVSVPLKSFNNDQPVLLLRNLSNMTSVELAMKGFRYGVTFGVRL